jgi:uracil-DNA glycosylase
MSVSVTILLLPLRMIETICLKPGVILPPSLKNIFKEIAADIGIAPIQSGDLRRWAVQGVLLLNSVLTVRRAAANSHKNKGWENFTTAVIKKINEKQTPVVFLLWGGNAKAFAQYITNPIHKIFTSVHPSPLSAYGGFFGCKHFSKCNEFLKQNNLKEIDWK